MSNLADEIDGFLFDESMSDDALEEELHLLVEVFGFSEAMSKVQKSEYKRMRRKGLGADAALLRAKELDMNRGDVTRASKFDHKKDKDQKVRSRGNRRSKSDPDKDSRFGRKHSTERGKKKQDVERIRRKKGDAAGDEAKKRILQKQGQSGQKKGKLKPGEKMVFGRVVKVGSKKESILADEIYGLLGESHDSDAELAEASEIEISDMVGRKEKEMKAIAKALSGHPTQVFDGVHGYIVNMDVGRGFVGGVRFSRAELAALLAVKSVRWLEFGKSDVSVGF